VSNEAEMLYTKGVMDEGKKSIFSSLNIVEECHKYRVPLWTCPPFLFIMMGVVIILSMGATWLIAVNSSEDPAVAVISVSAMTAFLFMVGHAVITSFQRLADASKVKSEFLNIVSHQLRSPLSAMKWQLEIILEQSGSVKGLMPTAMNSIKEQNERMIALVNDLLEVNRIEDDRLILRPIVVSLDSFIAEIVKEYKPLAEKDKKSFIFEVKNSGLWVFSDESKLRWVTENLLDNAIGYTKEGGEIRVSIIKDDQSARVDIVDNGIGIPVEVQKKIFSKFFRAENALRLRSDGTGLGLYLVRALVRAMKGKVGFISQTGKGSTFWFTLPLVKNEAQSQK
jgi:signal transduction histidine kinase